MRRSCDLSKIFAHSHPDQLIRRGARRLGKMALRARRANLPANAAQSDDGCAPTGLAPVLVAARLLRDLEKVACPLPETAELHDECVRICVLMMRSR